MTARADAMASMAGPGCRAYQSEPGFGGGDAPEERVPTRRNPVQEEPIRRLRTTSLPPYPAPIATGWPAARSTAWRRPRRETGRATLRDRRLRPGPPACATAQRPSRSRLPRDPPRPARPRWGLRRRRVGSAIRWNAMPCCMRRTRYAAHSGKPWRGTASRAAVGANCREAKSRPGWWCRSAPLERSPWSTCAATGRCASARRARWRTTAAVGGPCPVGGGPCQRAGGGRMPVRIEIHRRCLRGRVRSGV